MKSFTESLTMRLRAAYLHLHRSANRHFVQLGATADQYALMTALAQEEGVSQQDLAELLASDKRTIGKMVDLLEEKGWMERRAHPSDRRAWSVYLTREGRRRQKALYDSADFLRRRLEESVPPELLQPVLKCLENMAERLDPDSLEDVIKANTAKTVRSGN